jgi:hypothetical protein
MGEMSSRALDTVVVVEHDSGRRHLSNTMFADEARFVSGRVFFDHLVGLRALPASAPNGYALVEYWYDSDWMQQHAVPVTRFADVNELLEQAKRKVAEARAAGIVSNMDLIEVYGIVVD